MQSIWATSGWHLELAEDIFPAVQAGLSVSVCVCECVLFNDAASFLDYI